MYRAEKNGRAVRIPDGRIEEYKALGYTCTKLGCESKGKSTGKKAGEGKADKLSE